MIISLNIHTHRNQLRLHRGKDKYGLPTARGYPEDFGHKKSPIQMDEASLSERRDLNPRPRPWQGRALPAELLSHVNPLMGPLSLGGRQK